jgi:hypothetical protein
LLGYGINIDGESDHAFTPLHCAASKGNVLMVTKLIEKVATIHLQDHNGETSLDVAKTARHWEAVELLGGTRKKKLVAQSSTIALDITKCLIPFDLSNKGEDICIVVNGIRNLPIHSTVIVALTNEMILPIGTRPQDKGHPGAMKYGNLITLFDMV